jgi:LytR cell envelope-related transcriptional attenuator
VVDFPVSSAEHQPFPWRSAALVAGTIAVVELLLLLVVGGALIAKPTTATPRKAKAASAPAQAKAEPAQAHPHRPSVADLPRRKVTLLILNGNGRQGAAADAATRVRHRGYRVGSVGNAARHDYPRSLVMYRRGFEGEGVRLARDLRIKVVGPLDGIRPRQLHGAHAVLILGG